MWVLNHLYLIAQLGVIPAVLIFLYNRSRPIYATLRNTILATWLISVPGLRPVPRRSPAAGRHRHHGHDHASRRASRMDSNFSTASTTSSRRCPSLHVGFAVAVGFALFAALRNPALKCPRAAVGPGRSASPWSPPATTSCSTWSPASSPARAGYGLGAPSAARIRIKRPTHVRARPGLRRGLSAASAISASTVPTTVSTVLVPTKNAATLCGGHRLAGDRLEGGGEDRGAGADARGRERDSRPLHCANTTSRTAAGVAGRRERGQEAGERARARKARLATATAAPGARRRFGQRSSAQPGRPLLRKRAHAARAAAEQVRRAASASSAASA